MTAATDFADAVRDDARRADCRNRIDVMGRITGEEPGLLRSGDGRFRRYHYRYASGREGDWSSSVSRRARQT